MQQKSLEWINGGWRNDKYAKTVPSWGGRGIDVDGSFGFQCKDFVNALAIHLGAPFKAGNAIVLKQPQNGWEFVTNPQPGDVFVMDYVSGGVNYGHTGGVTRLATNGFYSVDQNYKNANLTHGSTPVEVFHSFSSPGLKFLRRKGGEMPADETDIKRAYLGILLRPATQQEISNRIKEGQTVGRVLKDLVESDESATIREEYKKVPEYKRYIKDVEKRLDDCLKGDKPNAKVLQPGFYEVKE